MTSHGTQKQEDVGFLFYTQKLENDTAKPALYIKKHCRLNISHKNVGLWVWMEEHKVDQIIFL